MMKTMTMLGLWMLAAGLSASGKPEVGLDYNGFYSDNIFLNATGITDYVSQVEADVSFPGKRVNFYLKADASLYLDNPDFNSFRVEPGVQYLLMLKGRNGIHFDASFSVLSYKELYTDFNYNGPRFRVYGKFHTSRHSILKVGYEFISRNYGNYESFDFQNHEAFVEYQRFFESQTRLFLNAGFNYRYYPHIDGNYDFGEDYNYYEHCRGRGHGNAGGTDNGNGWQGGNHGGPGGPGNSSGDNQADYYSMSVPNLHAMLRVSQNAGVNTVFSGEAELRHNYRGLDEASTLIKNAYIVYPYNDDYLWDGSRLRLEIKTLLFKTFSVVAGADYYTKDYRGIFIMDDLGEVAQPAVQRKDKLLLLNLEVTRKFRKLHCRAGFSYRDNDSNDPFFYYDTYSLWLGTSYYF